jgi:uncharacterized protein YegP (UPF0339 family)
VSDSGYHFVVYADPTGAFRWRFVSPDGRLVAVSGEGYLTEDDCKTALILLCREAKSGVAIEFDRSAPPDDPSELA